MNEPIFIIGLPRSGSSLFYRTIARHPDLAWISQATKKFPTSVVLSRIFTALRSSPDPTEGHRVWRHFARPEDDVLERSDVTDAARAFYSRLVTTHLTAQSKRRFLSKHPKNSLRIEFLDEIFPGAWFLHLIRDGRAVTRSILEMRERHGGADRYWGIRPPDWRELAALDPVESIARQWRQVILETRARSRKVRDGRYLEIRYEDFCAHPEETLRQVGNWAGFSWPGDTARQASTGIKSRNHKWCNAFTSAQQETLVEVQGDLLIELGYETATRAASERAG